MGDRYRSGWLIAATAIVPLLLFLILQSGFGARQQRQAIEARAQTTSSALIVAADGEVKRHFAGLNALATARSLRTNDLAEFRSRAEELIALNEGWRGVMLVGLASGGALVSIGDRRSVEITAKGPPRTVPRFAGFARGAGCPCLLFDRAALGPPGKALAVRVLVSADAWRNSLPPSGDHFAVTAIVDDQGRFISRSVADEQRFGHLGSANLRRAVTSRVSSGSYRGQTLENVRTYAGFTRSALTGWSAHVALATAQIDNPAWQFAASVGAAGILSLLLAAVLVAFALRQIAEGRRIAERMQQAQKLEALGQLTGGIAHDFNNLLTPVVGALDFVAKKPGIDASSKRLLAGALASAQRAGKLTNQLLAFSRRQKLTIAPILIAELLDAMADLMRQSIGDEHRLEVLQDDLELCALGDFNQLELAILNLLLNARDASPEGSDISLRVVGSGTADKGEVAVIVTDRGAGMDEETRLRAMEPFFTTKALGRGTGLGLAQVFGLAEQSGGRLKIDSAPGAGTTVTLTLRRCHCAEASTAPATERVDTAARPLHLLVVDDDPLVRAAVSRPLEDAGHVVDAVSDGLTALAAIRARPFDLVLVDFAMPGMNGAEMIRRGTAIRSEQRFLIVSGYADSAAIMSASANTPLLRKPFMADELLHTVRRLAG